MAGGFRGAPRVCACRYARIGDRGGRPAASVVLMCLSGSEGWPSFFSKGPSAAIGPNRAVRVVRGPVYRESGACAVLRWEAAFFGWAPRKVGDLIRAIVVCRDLGPRWPARRQSKPGHADVVVSWGSGFSNGVGCSARTVRRPAAAAGEDLPRGAGFLSRRAKRRRGRRITRPEA